MNYEGIIIEESLERADVLKDVKIVSTKVEPVIEKHKTPSCDSAESQDGGERSIVDTRYEYMGQYF